MAVNKRPVLIKPSCGLSWWE